ncbi:uncharacterized protein BKA55DRAFT_697777 [Fusarium redolens]|uniref:FAD-binding PCMH-type domain-containing protein n=1 Tax=Fusarium redolens TaxID=48865 RepID=A0A9P9FW53_FUSRE|nr:uncharacterized protein BKA55DRAFT_697777 [Fusarium redolens]KAH7213270.1 hypothetical protein BKA55DRAFT_697777 [Fusarium redolens]
MATSCFAPLDLVGYFGYSIFGQYAQQVIPTRQTSACQQLVNAFGDKTSLLDSSKCSLVRQENWSDACQLSPDCIFEPTTAEEVSGALRILVSTSTNFAVRSGGHMPVPKASNIDGGVLLSLSQLKTLELSEDKSIASVGSGHRWGDVYDWLSSYNLCVSGGRYDPVGVPGFLLGGGITFFGSKYGWAANMIANMEVVLANGTIVNANATINTDLFWALKGGSSNYGIVTRFDLKTFPDTPVYGGTSLFLPNHLDDFVHAIAAYSTVGGGSDDVDASYNPSVQVNLATNQLTLLSYSSHLGTDPDPAAFANFTKIPLIWTNSSVRADFFSLVEDTTMEAYHDRSHRQLFWATSLKASPESVYLTNETFFETIDSMPELRHAAGLSLTTTPQMLTRSWIDAAKASGGDPMDIDSEGGIIVHLITSLWKEAVDDDLVYEFSKRCTAAIDRKAKAKGLHYPFMYLNNAGLGQNPFQVYGQGKSLPKMKKIREVYDPKGIFQDLMPGGFKVGY